MPFPSSGTIGSCSSGLAKNKRTAIKNINTNDITPKAYGAV